MKSIELFSDGSFTFGASPGIGWLAIDERGREIKTEAGLCRNDGSNNLAAELVAAMRALTWAVAQGFQQIVLHTDLATMECHFRHGSSKGRRMSAEANAWAKSHPDVHVDFVYTPDSHPMQRRAHHLSRSCLGGRINTEFRIAC